MPPGKPPMPPGKPPMPPGRPPIPISPMSGSDSSGTSPTSPCSSSSTHLLKSVLRKAFLALSLVSRGQYADCFSFLRRTRLREREFKRLVDFYQDVKRRCVGTYTTTNLGNDFGEKIKVKGVHLWFLSSRNCQYGYEVMELWAMSLRSSFGFERDRGRCEIVLQRRLVNIG